MDLPREAVGPKGGPTASPGESVPEFLRKPGYLYPLVIFRGNPDPLSPHLDPRMKR